MSNNTIDIPSSPDRPETHKPSALRQLADSAEILGWMTDVNDVCIYLNPSATAVFGKWEDFDISAWTQFIHSDDFQRIEPILRQAKENWLEYRVEYRIVRSDGSCRWMMGSGAPRFSRDGDFEGYNGTVFDVTDRHEALERLAKSEAAHRLITESSSDLITHHAADGTLLFISPSSKRMLGYEPSQLVGASLFDYAHPDDTEVIRREVFNQVNAGSESGLIEIRIRHKDGHYIWVGTKGRVLTDPLTKEEASFVSVSRDVTFERKAKEELAKLAAENKALIENSLDVMALLDDQGRFLSVNEAVVDVLGYRPDELIGKQHAEFLLPGEQEKMKAVGAGLRSGKNTVHDCESRWVRKDGTIVHLSLAARWSYDKELVYATARDVTERYRVQAELQKSKDRLSSMLESIGDAFFAVDREWRITYANRKATEFAGLTQGAGIGRILWEVMPELLASPMLDHYKTVVETRQKSFFEAYWEPARAWIEVRAYPHEEGLSVYFHDITSRRNAEIAIQKSEQRFRNLFEQAGDSIIITDSTMRIVDANERACRTLGYTRTELLSLTVRDIAVAFQFENELWNHLRTGKTLLIQGDKKRKDGTTFPAETHVSRLEDDNEELFQAIVRDRSEREEAKRIIRETEQRFTDAIEMTPAGYVLTDADGKFVDVNPALLCMSGYTREELIGRHMVELFPVCSRNSALFIRGGATSLHGTETVIRHKSGHQVYALVNINIRRDGEGNGLSLTAFLTDMTERKQAEARLQQLATHDTLTGLPNRALLNERVEELLLSSSHDEPIAAMFIDLDRFKEVNDSFGHAPGDALLREVGRRLQKNLRPGDIVARLGGDEFVVVAHCADGRTSATKIVEKLFAALGAPADVQGQEVFVGASIGISMFPLDGQTKEQLFRNADTAMYRAKAAGRNCHRFYEAEMSVQAKARLTLEQALHRALERNEFELHYQPRIDMKTMTIVGMEALIRWNHPQMGQVSPMQFIPLAEERGLIEPIGRWVLQEACRQNRRLMDQFNRTLRLSVNLSARQLRSQNIVNLVETTLKEANLPAHLLELELTESALIEDIDMSAAVLKELKTLGLVLAVDDFGTGYSGLAYLRRFPLDILKLDRSFLSQDEDRISSFRFVKAFVDLAHALNLSVVAEGVENNETLQLLRDAACDEAQGYLLARPLSLAAFEEYLSRLPTTEAKAK